MADLPVSRCFDLPGELLVDGLLDPPHCPGQIASIGRYEILREIGRGGMGIVFLARPATASTSFGQPSVGLRPPPGNERNPLANTVLRAPWNERSRPDRRERPRPGSSLFDSDGSGGPAPLPFPEQPDVPPSSTTSETNNTDALLAIKVLRPDCVRRRRTFDRFLAEARHMRQLDHSNILKVLEVCDHPDHPYFAMPYFERGSLAALLRRGEPLSDADLLRIAVQLAEALCHTHAKGIIHRDLKAANVLLSKEGDAFLGDFGLARTVFNDSILDIHHEHGEGTLPYMSPAVARGEAEDTRCDIYGFGALLYEIMTRRPPYTGRDPAEIRSRILAGSPPPIRTLNPQAPAGLALVAHWAMARELRDRYAQMSDVLADLRRLQHGASPRGPHEPMAQLQRLDHPPAGPAQSAKLPPRRRIRMALGVGLAAVVVAVLAYGPRGALPGYGLPSRIRFVRTPGNLAPRLSAAEATAPREPLFLPQPGALLALTRSDPHSRFGEDKPASPHSANLTPARTYRFHALPEFARLSPGEWPEPAAMRVEDFDLDGRPELFARVGAPGLAPFRGLYCFDYESGSLLWRIVTGPAVHEILFADLEKDRSVEIIVGTTAAGQGLVGQDRAADDCSYLYVLNHDGKIRWRAACGGTWTQVRPLCADLDADGYPELLAWVEPLETGGPRSRPESRSRVALLNPSGQVTRVYDATARLWDCRAVDLEPDHRMEILAVDDAGQLLVFGPDLQTRARLQLVQSPRRPVRLLLHTVGDVDRDGRPEIILSASRPAERSPAAGREVGSQAQRLWRDHELIVLQRDFSVLARIPVEDSPPEGAVPNVSLVELSGSGHPGLLWQAGQTRVFECR